MNQTSASEKEFSTENESTQNLSPIKPIAIAPQLHLHHQIISHHPRAGINPVVDAASRLFTIMGELKATKTLRTLSKLQAELIEEMDTFQENIKAHGYNAEYTLVCRYVLCASIDELILATAWGGQKNWEPFSLLGTYSQDTRHQENFFSILERAIKEPGYYIDLMELMYICLSMGYRGRYRSQDYDPAELEQITNALYKHIRAYRGDFSKTLSPVTQPHKTPAKTLLREPASIWTTLLISGCIIMIIFIGLGYLMELISNEAISTISNLQTDSHYHSRQNETQRP